MIAVNYAPGISRQEIYECPCSVEGSAEHRANGVVTRITYLFETDGEGTVLKFPQEGVTDLADADRHEHGWRETFDKLKAVLEDGGKHE